MAQNMSRDIPITEIRPNPKQPRRHFDELGLQELAQSIALLGQVSPVLVRLVDGGFELVHGERRWRACMLAGLATVRAEVVNLEDKDAFVSSVVENVQRQDLTAMEEAQACRDMMDAEGLTQAAVARRLSKTRTWVAQRVRLLGLPEPVQTMVAERKLTGAHGRQLLKLGERGADIERLAEQAVEGSWSVARLGSAVDAAFVGVEAVGVEAVEEIAVEELVTLAFWAGVKSVLRHTR